MATDNKKVPLAGINPQTHPAPYNLLEWIEKNKADFKPPIGNKMIHSAGCQFKVMIVGGPNCRTDYHIEEGEEWFYMIKGDMVLKIVDGGVFRDVPIYEGESFLLPARVPHSPQRGPNSLGLVIERERYDGEMDGLRWYCQDPNCRAIILDDKFKCAELGLQIKARVERYYADEKLRTCPKCHKVDQKPELSSLKVPAKGSIQVKFTAEEKQDNDKDKEKKDGKEKESSSLPAVNPLSHPAPFLLAQWIEQNKADLKPPVGNKMIYNQGCQFKVMIVGGPNERTDYHIDEGEEWFWMIKGDMVLKVNDKGVFKDIPIKEGECFLLPGKVPHSPQRKANTIGLVVERERRSSEMDGLRWWCGKCQTELHQEWFKCADLGTQIKEAVNKHYADDKLRTCSKCGAKDERPVIKA